MRAGVAIYIIIISFVKGMLSPNPRNTESKESAVKNEVLLFIPTRYWSAYSGIDIRLRKGSHLPFHLFPSKVFLPFCPFPAEHETNVHYAAYDALPTF